MIEIRKSESSDSKNKYVLLVDDVLIGKAQVEDYGGNSGREWFGITILDGEASRKLTSYCISELPFNVAYLQLKHKFDDLPLVDFIWISQPSKMEQFKISFNYDPDLSEWRGAFSFADYYKELSKVVSAAKDTDIELELHDRNEGIVYGFAVNFPCSSTQTPIASEIARYAEVLRCFHDKVEAVLASRIRPDSIVMSFDFPEEVRVPCEQYLLYFVQFLHDLGVEATSELRHQAGQVLFTVTPTTVKEALEKIRTALDVYMQLPSSPISELSEIESDVEIQRLVANIHHLKGQVYLARAIIQQQQLTISQQQRLLDDHIIESSLVEVLPSSQGKEKEEVLGGLVAITPYEAKGITINLPKLFRWLKELFADEK
jgi:hypothetical protein